MSKLTSREIIQQLGLEPLPFEGGWFRQTYRSPESVPKEVLGQGYPGTRSLSTAIYYLMTPTPEGFSAFHRLPGIEVFHFYLGDPVESFLLHPDGQFEHLLLGADLMHGQRPQLAAPPRTWQAHRIMSGGEFALIGSTMSPGYNDQDFELGVRSALVHEYPQAAEWIRALTRDE